MMINIPRRSPSSGFMNACAPVITLEEDTPNPEGAPGGAGCSSRLGHSLNTRASGRSLSPTASTTNRNRTGSERVLNSFTGVKL